MHFFNFFIMIPPLNRTLISLKSLYTHFWKKSKFHKIFCVIVFPYEIVNVHQNTFISLLRKLILNDKQNKYKWLNWKDLWKNKIYISSHKKDIKKSIHTECLKKYRLLPCIQIQLQSATQYNEWTESNTITLIRGFYQEIDQLEISLGYHWKKLILYFWGIKNNYKINRSDSYFIQGSYKVNYPFYFHRYHNIISISIQVLFVVF